MSRTLPIIAISIALSAFGLGACSRSKQDSAAAERDRNGAAFKAGEVAHELSKEVGKAAKAAGREIRKDAHDAHEGWKEAGRKDRTKEEKKP